MIIFDTETTGLPQPEGAPLTIQPKMTEFFGIKVNEAYNKVDELEFLCNPGEPLEAFITKITGITDAMLNGQPPFASHYPKLVQFFLGEEAMAAHNLAFDRDIIRYELERISKAYSFPWPHQHICTVEKTMHLCGYRLSLDKLHNYLFDEGFSDAHRARSDTEALVRCMAELHKRGVLI